jgi:hypothetical protein
VGTATGAVPEEAEVPPVTTVVAPDVEELPPGAVDGTTGVNDTDNDEEEVVLTGGVEVFAPVVAVETVAETRVAVTRVVAAEEAMLVTPWDAAWRTRGGGATHEVGEGRDTIVEEERVEGRAEEVVVVEEEK